VGLMAVHVVLEEAGVDAPQLGARRHEGGTITARVPLTLPATGADGQILRAAQRLS
jgi:hypothetical protein